MSLEEPENILNVLLPAISIITLLILSVFLNTVGILLLTKYGYKSSKQTIIIAHISTSEILLSLLCFIFTVFYLLGHEEEKSKYIQTTQILICGGYFVFYTLLISLTIDRLLACYLTLRYKSVCTKKRLLILLVIIWSLGLLTSVMFMFLDYRYIYTVYFKIVFLLFDALFLVVAILTYMYLLALVFRSAKLKSGLPNSDDGNKYKALKVPTLIIITFMFFVVIPDIIYIYRFIITKTGSELESKIITMVWYIDFLCDSLIYIFLQKRLVRGMKTEISRMICFRIRTKTKPTINQHRSVQTRSYNVPEMW